VHGIENVKFRKDYLSFGCRPVGAYLILKGRNIPSVDHVEISAQFFDRKTTWINIEMIEAVSFHGLFPVHNWATER